MVKKNSEYDVFQHIDMAGGDITVCWPWKRALSGRKGDERPYFSVDGVRQLAYRIVYKLFYGELPDNVVVRHKCDNPACCNPHHLETGTQSDNEQDKYDRDRVGIPVAVVQYIKETNAKLPSITSSRLKDMVKHEFGYTVAASSIRNILTGQRRAGRDDKKSEDAS